MLVHDVRNPRAVALAEEVRAAVPELLERSDLTAVLGGDGFLLHTVHKYGFERRYLPLNAGTLGFMLNEVRGRIDEFADQIARDAFREYRFPLLAAHVRCTDGRTVTDHAMNDVYLERDSGQTARLSIDLEGMHFPEQLSADGLILATALGSTAYSFSAGGVACEPGLPVMCVTPICPHTPRLSPFIVRYGARVSVDVQHPDRRPVRVVIDGRDVAGVQRLEVGPTDATVRMVYLDGHKFTAEMVTKLLT